MLLSQLLEARSRFPLHYPLVPTFFTLLVVVFSLSFNEAGYLFRFFLPVRLQCYIESAFLLLSAIFHVFTIFPLPLSEFSLSHGLKGSPRSVILFDDVLFTESPVRFLTTRLTAIDEVLPLSISVKTWRRAAFLENLRSFFTVSAVFRFSFFLVLPDPHCVFHAGKVLLPLFWTGFLHCDPFPSPVHATLIPQASSFDCRFRVSLFAGS